MALLYATTGVRDVSLFQADIALPQQKTNRSWYASWLMTLPYGDRATEAFVQVGLLCEAGGDADVWPFVAYRHEGREIVFQTFAPRHTSKAANVQIDSSGQVIRLRIDGHTLFETPKDAFFTSVQSAHLYFQLGDEVSAYGDHVSGTLSDIQVRRPTGMWPYLPSCTYADHGLSILASGDRWRGAGVFRPGPGEFHGTWDNLAVPQCR
jgi:hypothetical protein